MEIETQATRNPNYGFYYELVTESQMDHETADKYFRATQKIIADTIEPYSKKLGQLDSYTIATVIRVFLDSKHGRHFADDVYEEFARADEHGLDTDFGLLDAIHNAVRKRMHKLTPETQYIKGTRIQTARHGEMGLLADLKGTHATMVLYPELFREE